MQIEKNLITKALRIIEFFKFLEITGGSRQKMFFKRKAKNVKKRIKEKMIQVTLSHLIWDWLWNFSNED